MIRGHRVLAHLLGCAKRDWRCKIQSDSDGVPVTFSVNSLAYLPLDYAYLGLFTFRSRKSKSHDAQKASPLAFARDHVDPERHVDIRVLDDPAADLRSRPRYRYRGLLPRAMRQDPPQPRAGEQVVEGRLQACRCVPSHVRLRRVPAGAFDARLRSEV